MGWNPGSLKVYIQLKQRELPTPPKEGEGCSLIKALYGVAVSGIG